MKKKKDLLLSAIISIITEYFNLIPIREEEVNKEDGEGREGFSPSVSFPQGQIIGELTLEEQTIMSALENLKEGEDFSSIGRSLLRSVLRMSIQGRFPSFNIEGREIRIEGGGKVILSLLPHEAFLLSLLGAIEPL